jgi:3-isopropylmalate/(R)-2-methylmalate dehydratase small subunit
MEKFQTLTEKVIPLPLRNVDTDMIIPAQYLTSIEKKGYGINVFRSLRDQDPSFPFNLEKFKNARILVTDHNFGCGSSREHAVWALQQWGIQAIIAPSFADIFFHNSAKNGLLLLTLPEKSVLDYLQSAKKAPLLLTLDLERQEITDPNGNKTPFEFDAFRKHCFLNGLDDFNYLNTYQKEILKFWKKRNKEIPFTTQIKMEI